MRLGGPVFGEWSDPGDWTRAVLESGYAAAYCPIQDSSDPAAIDAFAAAARSAGIVIAEVGAWSNPISPDEGERKAALALCKDRLAIADMIGARCCVNIAGSRGTSWDGPAPENFGPDTFELIVESVREIIDAVRPGRTFYTLEMMPWAPPDSPESYLELIEAVDRDRFAVHLDPVNIIVSPRLYYDNAAVIRECFSRLGPHIRSCHAKDIALGRELTVHLGEVVPGRGRLDYGAYLEELARLDPDTPLMLEHLSSEAEYQEGAAYIRSVASRSGLSFREAGT